MIQAPGTAWRTARVDCQRAFQDDIRRGHGIHLTAAPKETRMSGAHPIILHALTASAAADRPEPADLRLGRWPRRSARRNGVDRNQELRLARTQEATGSHAQ